MKKIRFEPNVPAEVRAIERETAMRILAALHRYAETGEGRVKPLSGDFEGLLRLRVGGHRVLFDETRRDHHRPPRPRSKRRLSVRRWG